MATILEFSTLASFITLEKLGCFKNDDIANIKSIFLLIFDIFPFFTRLNFRYFDKTPHQEV